LKNYYLLLGSNLGKSIEVINNTINDIEQQIGKVSQKSALYTSEAWGFKSQNKFFNIAIIVESNLEPLEFLLKIQKIEINNGRIRTSKEWTDRIIDIDILLIDDLIINNFPELIVPHKLLHLREFALKPLSEIAGNIIHPILKKTINTLLKELDK